MSDSENLVACRVCGGSLAWEVASLSALSLITSDVCPTPTSGRLVYCPRCATATKSVDALYLEEIHQTYDTYDLFSLSGGSDQKVVSAQGMST